VKGHRVRHRLMSEDEYVWMNNGKIYDENAYCLDHSEMQNFWAFRTDMSIWDKDWELCDGGPTIIVFEDSDEGRKASVEMIKNYLRRLTDEQRMEVFSNFCLHCGSVDPRCQCSNDE
jgi:hypothetical protein